MKLWKPMVSALTIVSLLMMPMTAVADSLESELSDVQTQMQEAQRRKDLAEMEIGSVSEVLRQIQVELDAALASLREIQVKQSVLNAQIQTTQAQLEAAQKRLDARERILHKRLRDVYIHGKLNYVEVVFGARNFADFVNRLEFLKRIVSADLELITAIKQERAIILEKQHELELQRKELDELEAQAKKTQREIESRKQDQLIILERLSYEKSLAEQSYQELQQQSNAIEARIRARQSQGAGSSQAVHGTGQFIWPVSGPITSPFGYRTHPIFGTQIFHSGLDIGVDTGTPVAAADSGVVVEADWLGGYGYAVIIDHGNGLSTVYAHNSELLVSAGQAVSQGQIIAYSGSTGYSTGPHVHFEVRENGTPVEPLNYL